MKEKYYSIAEVADLLSVSKETLRRWDRNGKLTAVREPMSNYRVYNKEQLRIFDNLDFLFNTIDVDSITLPNRNYYAIELFAGAGGLALGMEQAGIKCLLLNEYDHFACKTLRHNRPNWNVVEADVRNVSFADFRGKVDVVTGGFPCQAFSYAGKKLGLNDARGTLFYEFARTVTETQPAICIGENVRGLLSHDNGRTIEGMVSILDEIGYNVITPRIFKTIFYKVPQKRERVLIVGIRKDLNHLFYEFPKPFKKVYTLTDALKKGELYNCDVPVSAGSNYPKGKKEVIDSSHPGDIGAIYPVNYRKSIWGSYYLSGGKTGMARRMSWGEPSLTLTCSPAQKQTERCHPDETRPFTVREYARIQTFPDSWSFKGSISHQYKQIGNAVPVNFAKEVGYSIVKFLNRTFSCEP